ncbi:anhydro-N-acetylmuramic acid kinase [Xylella taiwanensis]|nr:anhydro-N-acetylmuramic acid kinase [Xylella taiwanensis]MCD8455599.1 anhydro-N-acetylmuramic acid kinase [Xylella taiwanensis]MCD8458006.1 anhydro-N-acetylmuramic acid kinase [Xylella taiwanensis]MCD8460142.1 anhydro-N-acetylmuramic acid kinase [Xylella taiwanensis]MCD8463800.1 anhydro-N-acetylmuramic acid kinase [Xylella taiwanensis]MCD8464644.1 anhydro-N-acetylmuramic acid kinase [Xylella taiwanensis]
MITAIQNPAPLYLGLMSGTSIDGIDAALVRINANAIPPCKLVAAQTSAWEPNLRTTLLELSQGQNTASLDQLGWLDAQVGLALAAAANALIAKTGVKHTQIRAIGSHGQTVRHRPLGDLPFTWQLGDAHRITELTGITTVADFRRRDIAAGGQGAPLMPAFHLAMLGSPTENRAVLNLGGIANLTLIPVTGPVLGFDTGPANALLDSWYQRHHHGTFDQNGEFAARGRINQQLLARLLADPWFTLPPPKSTGREQFHLNWVTKQLQPAPPSPADVQATLLELTAVTVADALLRQQPKTHRLMICGGGAHNPVLMARLAAHLPNVAVESIHTYGLDPDYLEAMGFAWLAAQILDGQPGNLPSVTGARGLRLLGAIHPA